MANPPHISDPPDICLLLRAHCEQRWLISEVVPVLRQIERPGAIPDNQLAAALAYLETLWLDARQRASETDAARARLDASTCEHDGVLHAKARRYHAAVRRLRAAVAHRVGRLMCPCHDEPPVLADR
jgi:hypothetical protein